MTDLVQVRDFRSDPYLRVHNSLLDNYGNRLGPTALATYMALCRYANNRTQSAFPSKATLAELIGVTATTVSAALKKLEAAGLIAVQSRFTEAGGQTSNLYTLLPVPEDTEDQRSEIPPQRKDTPRGVQKNTSPRVENHSRTKRSELDESNKQESSDDSCPPAADPKGAPGFSLETKASRLYFTQFSRKRWGTRAERDKFLSTEAEVGSAAMIEAVTWAAENRIQKVPAICTRARQIAEGGDRTPGARGKPDGTRLTERTVAEAFIAEERRRNGGGG